jgi:hypothetical protein
MVASASKYDFSVASHKYYLWWFAALLKLKICNIRMWILQILVLTSVVAHDPQHLCVASADFEFK